MPSPSVLAAVAGLAVMAAAGYAIVQHQRSEQPAAAAGAATSPSHASPPANAKAVDAGKPDDEPTDDDDQQAVVIHLPLRDAKFGSEQELKKAQDLEASLQIAITRAGSGAVDGNEIGEDEYLVTIEGKDADKLYASIASLLTSSPLAAHGFAIKRYGSADDEDAREVRVDFTTAAAQPQQAPAQH